MDLETLKTCLEILVLIASLSQHPWLLLGVTLALWGYLLLA